MSQQLNEEPFDIPEDPDDEEEAPPVHRMIDVELVLGAVGSFGRFQKFYYFLLCLPCCISAFFTLAPAFTAAIPNFRCFIKDCDDDSSSYKDAFTDGFANFTIPFKNSHFSSCNSFDIVPDSSKQCIPEHFNQNQQEACQSWIFDQSIFISTIVTDFQLVCKDSWKVPATESVFFGSVLIGAPLFGVLADKFGRRHVFMLGVLLMTFSGIALALAPSLMFYLIIEVFGAIGQVGAFQTGFILGVENVGANQRELCGVLIEFFFVFGEILLAFIAWMTRKWRAIFLYSMVPSLAFLLYWPFLPESIRWLQRRPDATCAIQTLADRMAKANKRPILDVRRFEEPVVVRSGRGESFFWSLLTSKVFFFRAFNMCFCWTVVSMCYYGLSLNAATLAGDSYLNFLLVALAEIPGYALSYVTMTWLGRRFSVSVSLSLGGLCLILDPFMPNIVWIRTLLFLLGKVGVTCAFGTIYLYTSELYPTTMRTIGVGTSSMCARIGAIIAPYIALLGSFGPKWLPLVIFGSMALASGTLTAFLPETLGKPLPETLEEALSLSSPNYHHYTESHGGPVIGHSSDDEENSVSDRDPLIS